MIIDAHSHFWEPTLIKGEMESLLDSVFTELGMKKRENLYDGTLERLLREMDEAGIDKTVILPLDFEFVYSGGDVSFRDFNDLAARYFREAPTRIIPFAGIVPPGERPPWPS